mgnify:CR=1 FL=1|tara:strand:- start:3847 stop:4107 length:261 start_codon:yes stop_codon:yes gene_type:complete
MKCPIETCLNYPTADKGPLCAVHRVVIEVIEWMCKNKNPIITDLITTSILSHQVANLSNPVTIDDIGSEGSIVVDTKPKKKTTKGK